MTLVESPAAPATTMMATVTATAPIRRSSSPTAVRRSLSPSPSASPSRRDRDRSGSRPHDGKGKENAEQGCDPQQQQHHHPPHSHNPNHLSQSPLDCKRASSSASPSCSSSARKRRLDGTPVAPAEQGASMMDVGALGSQRRLRRNSMSHHHDHNRSASPSPSRHEEAPEQSEAEAAAPDQRGEEEEEGAEPEAEGRGLHRSALEDSRVGEEGDNWDVPCGFNEAAKRTLRIEYWDRTRECKERKWDHMDHIDATYPSREAWIWQSVLHEAEVVLEPNMFPYNTPRGIEHWTLWARRELTLAEVEEYVLGWIARERPEVTRWNLDENAQRSIDIYHVHIYFQVVPDTEVGPNPPREPRRRDDEDEEEDEPGGGHDNDHPEAKRPCRRGEGEESEPSPADDVPSAPTSSSITGHDAEPAHQPAGASPSPSSA